MTKLRSLPYAVLTFSLLAAGGASAQSMGSIDAREAEQQQRIVNGVRDGSLTRGETYRLEQGERRIDRYEARAEADGHVSGYERRRLDGMLDRESREIHQQRTDGQRAGWNGGGWNGNEGRGGGWDRGGRDGWNRNGWDHNGPQHGWNSADGRGGWQNGGHQPGGWNQGGWNQGNANHGGWNQSGNQGGQGGWNQGGWNGHTPGTPSTPTTPTNGQPGGWSHNGGQAGSNPGGWSGHAPGTTPTTGGNAGWNGGTRAQPQYQAQATPRQMPVAATTQAQSRPAFNGGGGNGGGRRH